MGMGRRRQVFRIRNAFGPALGTDFASKTPPPAAAASRTAHLGLGTGMAAAEDGDGRGRRGGRSRGRVVWARTWPGPWPRLARWWAAVAREPSTAAAAATSSSRRKKMKTPRRRNKGVARPSPKITKPSRRSGPIRRMPPRHPRAPPSLPLELVEEVLLRVPPDDPAGLVRAAAACRRWRRLVADPAFRRRRLELHRATPPPTLLGVLCDAPWAARFSSVRFVPTSSWRPPRAHHYGMRCFDARHGRVLLHGTDYMDFVVWDPVTDRRVRVPRPPWSLRSGSRKATVLCAATGVCDHLDCHRGPFIVVLMGTGDQDMFCCIYSSESGAWSKPTYGNHPGGKVEWTRSALVGNTLFFVLSGYRSVLKYDLGRQLTSVIELPYVRTHMIFTDFVQIELTTLEDGRLGMVRVEKSNELCLWSRGEGDDDAEGWTLCKVIDLRGLFPLVDSLDLKYCLVGFAESVCVAFVEVQRGLYAIDMKSGLMKKVSEGPCFCAVPYINFCTPALEAPSNDDGQRVGISSA